MSNSYFQVPKPYNEPILPYGPNSPEREELQAKLAELKGQEIEIPLIIGGEEIKTGRTAEIHCPHNHGHKLGVYHKGGPEEVQMAIESALKARKTWSAMSWEHRVSIFLRAAELLAGSWRATLNGATMLSQSKTVIQAEIDSACELIDFWRFNPHFMAQLMADQPMSSPGVWNRVEYRPLEGFIFAVTPFNFTSIAGNLPTAPAMVGNVVVWKPASTAVYSAYFLMKLLQEAGMPPGVINFIPGRGGEVGDPVIKSPHLAGVHFTGSTAVFQGIWKTIGNHIQQAKYYPRIVGETGGKDFLFAHSSSDLDSLCVAVLRGAFEYQGQKCSALSRAYIPRSLWDTFKEKLLGEIKKIKMGDVEDFSNFMGAVIDKASFDNIKSYLDYASNADDGEIIAGGKADDSKGYFIEPTVIVTSNAQFKTMVEEIFGPVLTIYVYEDDKLEEALELCDQTSPYSLTGAVFGRDRQAVEKMCQALQNSAGNFYINDKPTGAVVGQQPFGGGRASGTNDKAGSAVNLLRWMSVRTIKETFCPPKNWDYPYMK